MDDSLRRLEKAFASTGSPEDAIPLVLAQLRSGRISPEDVELASCLGNPIAQRLVPPLKRPYPDLEDARQWDDHYQKSIGWGLITWNSSLEHAVEAAVESSSRKAFLLEVADQNLKILEKEKVPQAKGLRKILDRTYLTKKTPTRLIRETLHEFMIEVEEDYTPMRINYSARAVIFGILNNVQAVQEAWWASDRTNLIPMWVSFSNHLLGL